MNYVFDALGLEMMDHLLFTGVDAKGEITGNPDALKKARERGLEMASRM